MKVIEWLKNNPVNRLYDEVQMPAKIRRSLNFIVLGNIMGNAHGLICGGGTASMTPLFYLFSSPGNIWPTLLHNTIGALFWSGANLASCNLQLSCSPNETRSTHVAVFSCVTAFAGVTLGSLVGGALLESWHSKGMFAGSLDRYQVLCIVSVAHPLRRRHS